MRIRNKITATSSKTGLIANPLISYQSPNTTGTLLFKPKTGQTGTTTITVTVNDGGMNQQHRDAQDFVVTVINFANLAENHHGRPTRLRRPCRARTSLLLAVAGLTEQSPFKYQWKFNGANLPGEQNICDLELENGCQASRIPARLFSPGLQQPGSLTNSLPAVLTVITNPAPVFSPPVQQHGQFSFQISGVPGGKYVVESSADLQHWSPVATNTAPFTFLDSKASVANQKFYRSFYVEPK